MTGSSIPHHPFAGHQTSGCDSKEHMNCANENGDACANGLLRGQDGGDLHGDESIYAGKEMQRNGRTTREKASFDRSKSGLPSAVSLRNSYRLFSYMPASNLPQSSPSPLQTPFCLDFSFPMSAGQIFLWPASHLSFLLQARSFPISPSAGTLHIRYGVQATLSHICL